MDAIILAAGLGTRLRPHTLKTPKPLLKVQGRPLLDWAIGTLPPVDRLIVVVSYLAEQIEDYLRQQTHIPADRWVTVHQEKPRGTGDALRCCREFVHSDRLMVLNGDDLYAKADLAKLAECEAGILAYEVAEPRRFGVIYRREDGTLDRLIEKPNVDGPQLANIGAYVFPREVFDIKLPLSPRGEYEITDAVSGTAKRTPVQVVPATFWLPIGTIEAWEAAQTADLSPVG